MTVVAPVPVRTGACVTGCGKCCEFLELETNPAYLAAPDVLKWINLHGITLSMIDERCIARLPIPCMALQPDKSCGVYGTEARPAMCAAWPTSRLHIQDIPECGYAFTDAAAPQEVEDYGG